jgi:hypothetical protein
MKEYIYRPLDSIGLFTESASVFSSLCPYYITQGLLIFGDGVINMDR